MMIVEQPYEDAVTIQRMLTWPNTPTERRYGYADARKELGDAGAQSRQHAFRPSVDDSDTTEMRRMLERTSFEKRAARQYVNAVREGTENAAAALRGARGGCSAHTIGIAVAMSAEDEAGSLMTAVTYLSRDPDWMGMNPHLQLIRPDHVAAIFEAPAWDFAEQDIPGWILIGPAPYMKGQMSPADFPGNAETDGLREMLAAWGQTEHHWVPTRLQRE